LKEATQQLIEESRELSFRLFPKQVIFYKPDFYRSSKDSFPTFSVTGSSCALQCEHCKAEVLKPMKPALSPERLYEDIVGAYRAGAKGCLVSGGSRPDGSVPLEAFIDVIRRAKAETGMTVVVHTGLIRSETAPRLAAAGIDAALIDLLGDERSIREVYHLNATLDDYRRAVKCLVEAGIPLTPHYIVGLGAHGSALDNVLDILDDYRPKAFIVIALRPLPATPMAVAAPPSPEEVTEALAKARLRLGRVPLALGCMRPVGRIRSAIDRMAVSTGVNAVAHPTEAAYQAAREIGLTVVEKYTCCSEVFLDSFA
jgi:uncharacterized radical SAM superfamily protein